MFINGEELSQQIPTQKLRITDSLPQVLEQQYRETPQYKNERYY